MSEEAEYDRIVIGAGIIGACTAYQLMKAGHRSVLLLEQFPLPHSRGSSHGQTRVIRTAYRDPVQGQMARRSRQLWRDIEKQTGETLCEDCPMLVISPRENRTLFDTYVACLDERRVYGDAELSELLPAARYPPGQVGAVDRTAGLLRADRCLAAVHRLFAKAGGEIRDDWPVSGVHPCAGGGARVSGPRGAVVGRGLVVCAGAWAGPLLAQLGLPLDRLLTPLRVAVTYWRLRPGYTVPLSGIHLGPSDNSQHYYWLPSLEYPGLVKLCSHTGAPCDPDRRDLASTDHLLQQVSDYVAGNFPGLEPRPAIIETCMYTKSPDEICILDVHPEHRNIAFAAGMSGEGFKMGPVFGEVLQRLVDGQKPEYNLSTLSLKRFDVKTARSHSSL